MEESHYLFTVSHILQSVFPKDVVGKILEAFLSTRYENQQHVLLTWYRGWNSPKPDFYECPEAIWRRMPLSLQHNFINYVNQGDPLEWLTNNGWDLADIDYYTEYVKKNNEKHDDLMHRVNDFWIPL